MTRPAVARIRRIGLSVADLARSCDFYRDGLGFTIAARETRGGEGFAALMGLADAQGEAVVLTLGDQQIELLRFDTPGRPYPEPRVANDPWFQHFAIAVDDMETAYAALSAQGATPISTEGPERLPPSTGSVVAYKFRDPDGHPLELSYNPAGPWARPREGAASACRTVDHTALAVGDLETSLAFYVGLLGLRETARLVNAGPEQDRLDGLTGVVLDIVVLEAPEPGGPHIELLAYRSPPSRRTPETVSAADIAATRLIFDVADLSELLPRLRAPGAAIVSKDNSSPDRPARCLVRDPDGHLLELVQLG